MSKFQVGDIAVLKHEDHHCDKHPVTKEIKCSTAVYFSRDEVVRILDISPGWVRVVNDLQEVAWLLDSNLRHKDDLSFISLKKRDPFIIDYISDPIYYVGYPTYKKL